MMGDGGRRDNGGGMIGEEDNRGGRDYGGGIIVEGWE